MAFLGWDTDRRGIAVGIAAGGALLVGLWLLRNRRRKSLLARIPGPSCSFLTGNLDMLLSDKVPQLIYEEAKKHGPLFRLELPFPFGPILVLVDPSESVRLVSRGDDYIDKAVKETYDAFNQPMQPPLPHLISLATSDPYWKAMRRTIAACFSATAMRELALPAVLDVSQRLAQHLTEQGPEAVHNMSEYAKRITADVIGKVGFNFDTGCVSPEGMKVSPHPVVSLVNNGLETVHYMAVDPTWKLKTWTPRMRKLRRGCLDLQAYIHSMLREVKKNAAALPAHSMARAMLDFRHATTGKPISDDQFASETFLLFVAGFETTSNAIAFAFLYLLVHPECMKKVETELDGLGLLQREGQPPPRQVAWEDIGRLQYLTAVIKETLRIASPAALGPSRKTHKEMQVCGFTVPKDTVIAMPFYAIDRDPVAYGPDPDDFRPERFLSISGRLGASAAAATNGVHNGGGGGADEDMLRNWVGQEEGAQGGKGGAGGPASRGAPGRVKEPMAFSVGPRDCVGQRLAQMEMHVFLASLLGRFKPELAGGRSGQELLQDPVYHITLAPPPLHLRFIPRG